ncbi:DUF3164 family protein [Marinobacterium litorale]|uniref:DUF3164 family protein n=1 Tax=Marinobacterium litorale TaxID=404770 RepID=UPI0003F7B599|nr:DUF3164 family protein [Marinobacterium litorale]
MNTHTQMPQKIPEGFLMNHRGDLVRVENISEQDQLRDQVVSGLVPEAVELNERLLAFKKRALSDIDDLIDIAKERIGVQLGGKKGNIEIRSYDGRFKVVRAFRDLIAFTEEVEAARQLIENCIERWGSSASTMRHAFEQAFGLKDGKVRTYRLLEMLSWNIPDDEEWDEAMQVLRAAMRNSGTAVYVRIYERIGESNEYKPVALDLAKL